ncbi:MAG: signal peptidase II [Oligoflexia bacterium]|nr:signal peptidase II [Oligoflexia bacterium]
MKIRYLLLLTISGAIIALDQLTKLYIHTRFILNESRTVIPGFFDITYVRNTGAAFGLLSQSHPTFREVFFTLIPLVAMGVILWIMRSTQDSQRLQVLSLSMIFGGAIGNYIDRLRFGYVIDFLDFHIQSKYHWPAFNIADSAIVCGVGILLLIMGNEKKNVPKAEAPPA